MNFDLDEDQSLFLGALEQIAATEDAGFRPDPSESRFEWSAGLDDALADNGFLDAAAEPSLGCLAAAAMVFRLAQSPVLTEAGASALLRPLPGADLPRPIAVCERSGEGAIRFLPVARTLLWLGEDAVRVAPLAEGDIEPVESLFAYPTGRLRHTPTWRPCEADPIEAATRWRIALAAEIAGTLKGGLEAVLAHVRIRQQFGRPLGSFQAVQHRLATASVRIEGAYWLTMKAAESLDPGQAALALGHAQGISTAICTDLHQFMGAMGLTLEHPLHRWTYRARALRSAMGGAAGNLARAATTRWETP